MDPKHTWIMFDMRPMKAAAHHAIDEAEAGRLTREDASARLGDLAESVPDLDASKYKTEQARLLTMGMFDRSRRLVDCFSDYTPQPWVKYVLIATWWGVKLGALAAFVWFVVWLAS